MKDRSEETLSRNQKFLVHTWTKKINEHLREIYNNEPMIAFDISLPCYEYASLDTIFEWDAASRTHNFVKEFSEALRQEFYSRKWKRMRVCVSAIGPLFCKVVVILTAR